MIDRSDEIAHLSRSAVKPHIYGIFRVSRAAYVSARRNLSTTNLTPPELCRGGDKGSPDPPPVSPHPSYLPLSAGI
jgi:hypothetical protein